MLITAPVASQSMDGLYQKKRLLVLILLDSSPTTIEPWKQLTPR